MSDLISGARADLVTRIDAELRERLEEAVEFLCLDVMVQRRGALGLPPPEADSAGDRAEFTAQVRVFLERLGDLAAGLGPEQRRKVEAAQRGAGDETARLLAVQLVLARELPDYWHRFDAARVAYAAERIGSGGERRGLFGRLFGGG
jgi:hypothetical protein